MARRSSLSAVLVALSVTAGSVARADAPPPPTSPPPDAPVMAPVTPAPAAPWQPRIDHENETTWYGWQTLTADGTSLLVLPIAAGAAQSPGLGYLALAGYFLAPPIIHGAHGRWGMFAASLGLRVVMPIVGGLIGAAAQGDCSGGFICIPVGAVVGVAVGALGAVALDASLLSYEPVESDTRPRGQRSPPSHLAWSPTIAPRKEGGFTLGIGASF